MTTRTPTQHGERRCYLRGCRRPECLDAHYRYMSRWRLDAARGQQRRIDPTPAADHARKLLDAGWTQTRIADATGCAHRTIGALINGTNTTISRETAAKVLALTTDTPPPPMQYTDSTGTVRRLRALVVMGHSIVSLADAIGMHHSALAIIVRGELAQVRVTTDKATRAVYRQKSRIPGTSQRARNFAAKRGWHGPLAWDTDTIDDPTAGPDLGDDPQPPTRTALAIAEEIHHLATCGISEHEIARRVGRSRSYVHEQLAGRRGPGWRQNLREAA